MTRAEIEDLMEGMIDELAAIEHERWSHWQRYVHEKGRREADGSVTIPAELVEQWEAQIDKPYVDLSEDEKESDREQVRKYMPVIVNAFAAAN